MPFHSVAADDSFQRGFTTTDSGARNEIFFENHGADSSPPIARMFDDFAMIANFPTPQ